jgi:CheY-like chemotaxis protein
MNPPLRPGPSVLLVEDHELVRDMMRLLLEGDGYRVTCAGDGREALHLLRTTEPPSVVVLDLLLPVLDGWNFLQVQKGDPALATIPVVVVSAADSPPPPQGTGYIRKPFRLEELLDAVRDAVEGTAGGRGP